jgi:hypothetical protein
MPIVEVNGQEIEFPDDMAPEQIKSVLQRKFPPADPSFTERVGQAYDKRLQNMQSSANEAAAGNQTNPEAYLQFAGQTAGLMNDAAVEGFKSAASGLSSITPDFIEKPVLESVKSGLNRLGDTHMGRTAIGAVDEVTGAYGQLAKNNPRLARNLEAATNLGLLVPVAGAAKGGTVVGADLASKGAKIAAKPIAKTAEHLNTKKIYPSFKDVKKASQDSYALAKQKGAAFKIDATEEFIRQAAKEVPSDDFARNVLGTDEATDFVQRLSQQSGNAMTLESFEQLDKALGDLSHKHFTSDPGLSRKYGRIQDSLREIVENPNFVDGSDEGIKAMREGTRQWSIQAKMRDIERIIDDAQYYQVPSTAIKTGFRRIATDPKKMAGYSDAEKKAIRSAAKTGKLEGILGVMGSRLNAIGGGTVGGIPGAAIGYGVSEMGRAGAELVKRTDASTVSKLLAERSGLVKTEPRFGKKKVSNESQGLADALLKEKFSKDYGGSEFGKSAVILSGMTMKDIEKMPPEEIAKLLQKKP